MLTFLLSFKPMTRYLKCYTVSVILEVSTIGFFPVIVNNIDDGLIMLFHKIIFLFQKNVTKNKIKRHCSTSRFTK